jgi:hypothetical protein
MHKDTFSLAGPDHRDLVRPFPLIQDLFTFAQKNGITNDGFTSQDFGNEQITVPLPETFSPLVQDFPNKYLVVAYDDRRSNYYKIGTRHQLVRLSTVENRRTTDTRTREIDIKLRDGARADRVEVRVREAVKDKSFDSINTAQGEDIEQPHGSARYTYELDPGGKKYPKKFEFDRLDEGLFIMGEKAQPVRWVRRLEIEKNENAPNKAVYEDYYIIGRNEDPAREKRASIKTTVIGELGNKPTILLQVGYGSESTGDVLLDDKEHGITFIVQKSIAGERPLDILKDDPVYAALLKTPPDTELFIELLGSKMKNLQEDWDKPQSIYARDHRIETSDPNLSVRQLTDRSQ